MFPVHLGKTCHYRGNSNLVFTLLLLLVIVIPQAEEKKRNYDHPYWKSTFRCDCGKYDGIFISKESCAIRRNQTEEARMAKVKAKIEADRKRQNETFHNNAESRIVNGRKLDKNCEPRPWMVHVRVLPSPDKPPGECGGAIINRRFVLSAAHCFCNIPDFPESKCEWNDQVQGARIPPGHYDWIMGTRGSRVTYDVSKYVTIISPGFSDDYSIYKLTRRDYGANHPNAVYKAEEVIIHPDYVKDKRDQSDIALVKTDRFMEFKVGKLAPICLPDTRYKDVDRAAYVAGWGRLYESDGKRGSCYTDGRGPSKFKKCRDWFIKDGELGEGCEPGDPPVGDNDVCRTFHADTQYPKTKYETTKVTDENNKTVTCYPSERRKYSKEMKWCATCVEGAKPNEPGYCDPELAESADQLDDYEDMPDSVSPDKAWGFCDPKCNANPDDLQAEALNEVKLYIFSKEKCSNETWKHPKVKYRARIDRELCAMHKSETKIEKYRKVGDDFTYDTMEVKTEWGGSDSCQGDSGGPLYSMEGHRAVLLGIVNRGEGCARGEAVPIYARVKHYMKWIKANAREGRCPNKHKLKKKKMQ